MPLNVIIKFSSVINEVLYFNGNQFYAMLAWAFKINGLPIPLRVYPIKIQ
jgi:hypothetical protein